MFASLIWAIKILTIENPVEIMKYEIPSKYFTSEELVRNLMNKRVEFSLENVKKSKINLV